MQVFSTEVKISAATTAQRQSDRLQEQLEVVLLDAREKEEGGGGTVEDVASVGKLLGVDVLNPKTQPVTGSIKVLSQMLSQIDKKK